MLIRGAGRGLVLGALLALLDWAGWAMASGPAAEAITDVGHRAGLLAARPLEWWLTAIASTGCLAALTLASLFAALTLADLVAGAHIPLLRLVARALTPQLGRRLLLGACGVGVAGSTFLGGAATADDDTTAAGRCRPACALPVGGLPLPQLPTRHGADATAAHVVVVRSGDSLWQISERLLPLGASDAEIAASVERLYARNRRLVGPDPDLIFPGMHLVAPKGFAS